MIIAKTPNGKTTLEDVNNELTEFSKELGEVENGYPISELGDYQITIYNQPISYDHMDIKDSPLIYRYFLKQCKYAKHIALIGQDFPEPLIDKIYSHFWEFDDEYDENNIFKPFDTVEDFEEYISSKYYDTDEVNYPKICFGISKIDKFIFGIHYDTVNVDEKNSSEIEGLLINQYPRIPEFKSNKREKIKIQENLDSFTYYKNSGYLMIMKLIYDYILEEVTGNPDSEINFSIIPMIFDKIIENEFHRYLFLLGFFIIVGYSPSLKL